MCSEGGKIADFSSIRKIIGPINECKPISKYLSLFTLKSDLP